MAGRDEAVKILLKALNAAPAHTLEAAPLAMRAGLEIAELESLCRECNRAGPIFCLSGPNLSLERPLDLLDEEFIFRNAKGSGRVEVAGVVDSTNSVFLNLAGQLANGDALLAELQLAGRGTRARTWLSPPGCQVTLSLAHYFADLEEVRGLTVATGVVLAQLLHDLGIAGVKLRWPNDLCLNGRKLCGILVETAPAQRGVLAVTGVGLNVYPGAYGSAYGREPACLKEAGCRLARSEIAARLIGALRALGARYAKTGLAPLIPAYQNLSYLDGCAVRVQTGTGELNGTACGLNARGELLVRRADGTVTASAGPLLAVAEDA